MDGSNIGSQQLAGSPIAQYHYGDSTGLRKFDAILVTSHEASSSLLGYGCLWSKKSVTEFRFALEGGDDARLWISVLAKFWGVAIFPN